MINEITPQLLDSIIKLFHDETPPAEGCTEPIAVALAAAKVTEVLGQKPEKMQISVSGNIIKNVLFFLIHAYQTIVHDYR